MKNLHVKQEEFKQETLEEAARRYTESTPDNDPVRIFSFIEGAKWQAEQNREEIGLQNNILVLLINRIDDLKRDKRIMFGDENFVYKAPMGGLRGIHPDTSEFYLYVYDRLIKELEGILNVV